jgi:hypothetical protein
LEASFGFLEVEEDRYSASVASALRLAVASEAVESEVLAIFQVRSVHSDWKILSRELGLEWNVGTLEWNDAMVDGPNHLKTQTAMVQFGGVLLVVVWWRIFVNHFQNHKNVWTVEEGVFELLADFVLEVGQQKVDKVAHEFLVAYEERDCEDDERWEEQD